MPFGTDNGDNRRRAARHDALLSVALRVAEDGPHHDGRAVVSSISRSGIFVATPTKAAVGQTVRFEFTGPDGPCMAVGMIIENRGAMGFVVEFQGETMEMKSFFDLAERMDDASRWQLLQGIDDGVIEIV
jgi:hypothetical protein